MRLLPFSDYYFRLLYIYKSINVYVYKSINVYVCYTFIKYYYCYVYNDKALRFLHIYFFSFATAKFNFKKTVTGHSFGVTKPKKQAFCNIVGLKNLHGLISEEIKSLCFYMLQTILVRFWNSIKDKTISFILMLVLFFIIEDGLVRRCVNGQEFKPLTISLLNLLFKDAHFWETMTVAASISSGVRL